MNPESFSDAPSTRPRVPRARPKRRRRGPNTSEGKRRVRYNAVRHGIFANLPVIAGVEREEEWETHRTGVLQSLAPSDYLELTLAERVALITWRLARVARYEAALLAEQREKHPLPGGAQLRPLETAAGHGDARRRLKLLQQLPEMPEQERLSPRPVMGVLETAARKLSEVHLSARESGEVQASLYDPPEGEVPDGTGRWTVKGLLDKITALAAVGRTGVPELMQCAVAAAERDVALYASLRRMQTVAGPAPVREIPPAWFVLAPEQLELVARYEAHLNRQLVQTLHELEARQKRRWGEAAPLARLDVAGLSEA